MRLVFSFLQNKQDYSIASEKTHGLNRGMKASVRRGMTFVILEV
jgi:hypothetical protein